MLSISKITITVELEDGSIGQQVATSDDKFDAWEGMGADAAKHHGIMDEIATVVYNLAN